MQDRNEKPKKQPDSNSQVGESTLESTGEVVVTHHATPPKTRPDKRIHPRRPLPLVPIGPERDSEDDEKAG